MNKIKGVIFDLDGVIVSTDEFHYKAWKEMADAYNLPFSERLNDQLRGVSRADSLEIILNNAGVNYNKKDKIVMLELKNNIYVRFLDQLNQSAILPGVLKTLKYLKHQQIKLAIGSSSKNAITILNNIHLNSWFDFVADGTKISNSKPDPEVFLLAAKKLNLSPQNCLVVEDAESGIKAAKNANMQVLGVGQADFSVIPDYYSANLDVFNWELVNLYRYEEKV